MTPRKSSRRPTQGGRGAAGHGAACQHGRPAQVALPSARRRWSPIPRIYENLRQKADGKLTIAQRTGVRGLADVQAGIKDETAGLIEQLEGAPVFSLTLKKAAEQMDKAAKRLQALKTDEETEVPCARPPIGSSSSSNRSRPTPPSRADSKLAGAAVGVVVAGARGATEFPRPPSSRCSSRFSKRSTTDRGLRRTSPPQQATDARPDQGSRPALDDQGALADLVRDLTRPKRDDGEE